MGATPAWYTLNLSLPQVDPRWLEGFLHKGCSRWQLSTTRRWWAADTTRGPLTIGIQIMGFVPHGQALKRAGARPGGSHLCHRPLGRSGARAARGAGASSSCRMNTLPTVLTQLNRPVAARAGRARVLRGLASRASISPTGCAADLGHILAASAVGARIHLKRLPLSPAYDAAFEQVGWQAALAGGDDYELCFTIPPAHETAFRNASAHFGVACSYIGDIEAEAGLRIVDEQGSRSIDPGKPVSSHFRADLIWLR